MAQTFSETRIPFSKMTFTPDIPSTALGPNEYNDGLNVESDVRGIRSTAGDEQILSTIPGTPTFMTGGYRLDDQFFYIVATTEGYWYATNGTDATWHDITPESGPFTGYDQATNITESWSGVIPFFNDSLNPPMFWPNIDGARMIMYSNTVAADIADIVARPGYPNQQKLTFKTAVNTPYTAGERIVISGVDNFYNGTFIVAGGTVNELYYYAVPGGTYPGPNKGQVSPIYQWNYNPNWKKYHAGFMRIYNTPNVGSILVAGNLTVTLLDDTVQRFPVTVQWSQSFGQNQAPLTWAPTITNIANQLEVPLRGTCVDAFAFNGQFFLSSYWDTVVFSPINYTTTSAPILGVRLFNQGRGMLTSNAWANTDRTIYGVDARDIWVFDGNDFQGLGNQRVKNWFFDQLDPLYVDRMFMECNTQKNQIEIYYTTKAEYENPNNPIVNGVPNKMISYRYDLDCWNAPRDVASATFACEAPIFNLVDSIWTANKGSRTISYAPGLPALKVLQKDQGYSFLKDISNPNGDIESYFRRDNIKLLKDYSGKLLVHRILPEVVNLNDAELPIDPTVDTGLKGNVTITILGANSVGSTPSAKTPVTIPVDANGATNSDNPWAQINQNAFRVNSININNTSNSNIWMCSAMSWQITQTEDDR